MTGNAETADETLVMDTQRSPAPERFEVLAGRDPRIYKALLIEGFLAINKRSPTGYDLGALYDRVCAVCNRPDRPENILLVCADYEAPGTFHGAACAFVVCWLGVDWMGTPLVCLVHLYVRPGYKKREIVHQFVPHVDKWTRAMGARRQYTLTGRTDERDKSGGGVTGYARWITPIGFHQAETMFTRRLP